MFNKQVVETLMHVQRNTNPNHKKWYMSNTTILILNAQSKQENLLPYIPEEDRIDF